MVVATIPVQYGPHAFVEGEFKFLPEEAEGDGGLQWNDAVSKSRKLVDPMIQFMSQATKYGLSDRRLGGMRRR